MIRSGKCEKKDIDLEYSREMSVSDIVCVFSFKVDKQSIAWATVRSNSSVAKPVAVAEIEPR